MKKFLSVFFILSMFISHYSIVEARTVTLRKTRIVNELNSIVRKGTYKNRNYNGYCLKFVADFWASHGASRSSAVKAIDYCNSLKAQAKWRNIKKNYHKIPVGSDIFFDTGSKAKHIGIYIGKGYFIHAYGNRIKKFHLLSKFKNKRWKDIIIGYSYHRNIRLV